MHVLKRHTFIVVCIIGIVQSCVGLFMLLCLLCCILVIMWLIIKYVWVLSVLETVGGLIRPFTLVGRLSINLMAGHVLLRLSLRCSDSPNVFSVFRLIVVVLYFMELGVQVIQCLVMWMLYASYLSKPGV